MVSRINQKERAKRRRAVLVVVLGSAAAASTIRREVRDIDDNDPTRAKWSEARKADFAVCLTLSRFGVNPDKLGSRSYRAQLRACGINLPPEVSPSKR